MKKVIIAAVVGILVIIIYSGRPIGMTDTKENKQNKNGEDMLNNENLKEAVFAGGCFWCVDAFFERTEGVVEAITGYTGGKEETANYEQVSSGKTSHYEAVKVIYDSSKTSYEKLLHVFWEHIDPTDSGGQFVDRGTQYKTAVFYSNEEEKQIAEKTKSKLENSDMIEGNIATAILPIQPFYKAEEYHQDYYQKKAANYEAYAEGSGRYKYIEKTKEAKKEALDNDKTKNEDKTDSQNTEEEQNNTADPKQQSDSKYAKPSQEEIAINLTEEQYKVTQQEATERPFANEYWDNKEPGIYVDVVTGEPLFSSLDKYDSGSGWPSFTKPLEPENIETKKDKKLLMTRTEVRSKYADSHLGHVFKDGPKESTGLRYCINSASLRFIPADKLEEEGYGQYSGLFR